MIVRGNIWFRVQFFVDSLHQPGVNVWLVMASLCNEWQVRNPMCLCWCTSAYTSMNNEQTHEFYCVQYIFPCRNSKYGNEYLKYKCHMSGISLFQMCVSKYIHDIKYFEWKIQMYRDMVTSRSVIGQSMGIVRPYYWSKNEFPLILSFRVDD